VVAEENLAQNARKLGKIFREELGKFIETSNIATLVRGKGLLNAVVINDTEDSDTAWNISMQTIKGGEINGDISVTCILQASRG
jgi:ornithine--oxo-acid transaminase